MTDVYLQFNKIFLRNSFYIPWLINRLFGNENEILQMNTTHIMHKSVKTLIFK